MPCKHISGKHHPVYTVPENSALYSYGMKWQWQCAPVVPGFCATTAGAGPPLMRGGPALQTDPELRLG
jgi:hypothetical protein